MPDIPPATGSATGPKTVTPVTEVTPIRSTVASYSYSRSVAQVHQEFAQLDPQAISDACLVWKRAADELTVLANDLKAQAAVPLSAAWSSPSSPEAQQQLQLAEATARALANDCLQMAHATDYAAQYAQWYKANLPSYTDALLSAGAAVLTQGPGGITAGADAAVTHLTNLLSRYNEVIQVLPPSVASTLVTSGSTPQIADPYQAFTPAPVPGGPTLPGAGGSGIAPGQFGVPGSAGSSSGVPGIGSGVGGSGVGSTGTGASGAFGPGAGGTGIGATGTGGTGAGGPGFAASGTGGAGSGIDPYAAGGSLAGTGLGTGPGVAAGASGVGGAGTGLGAAGLDAAGLGAGGLGSAASGVGGLGASGLGASGLGTSGLGASGLGASGLGASGLGASGVGAAGRGASGLGASGVGGRGVGQGASLAGGRGTVGAGGLGAEEGGVGGGRAGLGAAGAAEGEAMAGRGGMAPMGGAGGQGQGEEERERSTWLMEDEDVWGDDGDVPPPVIAR